MGVEEARRGGGGGKRLALASIGFAEVRVGAAGGAGFKDDLVVVGLPVPKDDGLDVFGDLAIRLPDVGAAVRNFLRNREVAEFVSGAMAGAMTKAVLAPLETIRTRMVVGVGSKHIFGSFVEIIEQNGWQGLWAGNTINMLRIIPTQAIELGTFEYVKRSMASAQEKWKEDGCPKIELGNLKIELPFHLLSPIAIGGAAAGIASTLACHPLEVLKDRMTVNREAYPSIAIAINKIYHTNGIGGLYAGLCPTLVGMLPYSTCYYFMYETIKTSYCHAQKKKSLSRPELLARGYFRPNGKHNQLPSGSGKEAAYGGIPTREVPTPHDCCISRGGPRRGLEGAFPRMGSELPEGHADVRRHLDVLRGMEGYPFGSTAPWLARALLQNKFVLLCGSVGFPIFFSFQIPHVPIM